jgi:uncharacterized protein (AIM24 family)
MQHEIMYKPAYTLLEVKLEAGERLEAESGAMVYMSPGMRSQQKQKAAYSGRLPGVYLVANRLSHVRECSCPDGIDRKILVWLYIS